MKIFPKKIDGHLKDIAQTKIKAVLIYGPDQGMVSSIVKKIINSIQGELVNLSFNEINDKRIKNHLSAQNLFGNKEILKITGCTNTLHEDAKQALLEEYDNFPIFIAEELTTSSSLRKFFEADSNLAIISCYPDEDVDLRQFTAQIISKAGKKLQKEALDYLCANLKGDRFVIEQELNKLIIYCNSQSEISLSDVEQVISPSFDASADLLCYNFASQNTEGYFNELNKLYNDNISPIWILRALIRFYSNLYMVKAALNDNVPIEVALKSAKPPIFFKYLPSFRKLVLQISITAIDKTLSILLEAESQSKTTGAYAENICEELFFRANKEDLENLEL
ncbi:MAG: holA [Rickettsiaceae bacterium]|jgi:DNA polymerase-3 subunit delta|nr:holA [Rickettsiaceae bacterium]